MLNSSHHKQNITLALAVSGIVICVSALFYLNTHRSEPTTQCVQAVKTNLESLHQLSLSQDKNISIQQTLITAHIQNIHLLKNACVNFSDQEYQDTLASISTYSKYIEGQQI